MLTINIIQTLNELKSLEQPWRTLADKGVNNSIFSAWDWQYNWWQHYGESKFRPDRELKIITAKRSNKDECVAIVPLYIDKVKPLKMKTIRELRFMGTGGDTSPDYLSPQLAPDLSEQELHFLCAAIVALNDWDLIRFTDLCDSQAFISCLKNQLQPICQQVEEEICSPIRYIELNTQWPDYLASLSSNQRKQIKRRRRRFEELGNTEFFAWPSSKPVDDAFDALVALHTKRWAQKEGGGSFNSSHYLSFHKTVMRALHSQDNLRLYCLQHKGHIMAMEYSYKWKNSIFSFQCGFDPDYAEHRPGQLLLNYSIEHAISEGMDQYDMLKGDYDYKASAAKLTRNTIQLTAFRNNFAGHFALLGRNARRVISQLKHKVNVHLQKKADS